MAKWFYVYMVFSVLQLGFDTGANAQSEDTALPKAAITDFELEARIIIAVNQYAISKGWKEVFYKAIITSEQWSILRDFNTGSVSGRIIDAAVIAILPDNNCTFREFKIKQGTDGKNYSKELSRYSSTFPVTCSCEGF